MVVDEPASGSEQSPQVVDVEIDERVVSFEALDEVPQETAPRQSSIVAGMKEPLGWR
ncbi:hypothetical protein [Micromonospora schwarzwaldensis]